MKLIFTYDLLRPVISEIRSINNRDQWDNAKNIFSWLEPILYGCIGQKPEILYWEENSFDAEKFFHLAGKSYESILDWAKMYHLKSVNQEAEEYMCSFFADSFVVGFELSNVMMNIFNKYKIPYLNFTIHPVRFLDDIFLMFNTNVEQIYNKLIKYRVSENCFYEKVGICNLYCRRELETLNIDDNSALIIGQTKYDASICKENSDFANLMDYKEQILAIKQQYKTVYFKPHPYEVENKQLMDFMSSLNIKSINDNFYQLLSDERLKGVYALSSSCVEEAKYFNKNAEFLYKSAFDIATDMECEFNHLRFVGVYGEYFNQYFWADLLDGIFDVHKVTSHTNITEPNRLRNLMKAIWSYDIFMQSEKQQQTKTAQPQHKLKWYQKIFSVKNECFAYKKHKVITILGIKLKFKKLYKKSYKLDSGERQTATNIKDIRQDHLNRYNLAIDIIKSNFSNGDKLNGLDCFCGNGYGSFLIANKINTLLDSIDGSKDAIKCAKKYYKNDSINYIHKLFPFKLKKNSYDFVVSLESIEHIKDDMSFLKEIYNSMKDNGLLIISTPNMEKQDLNINTNHFHFRHYYNNQFIQILQDIGFEFIELYGQDTYIFDEQKINCGLLNSDEMDLKKDYNGQFSVFVIKKSNKHI